ncbi:MAG: DarT1-associated NADAR antitoxin family protein [Sphingomicrobium sp.]
MAQRPIFLPMHDGKRLVRELYVEFRWNPGMAISQKQKNVRAIHEAARERFRVSAPLEVSSKSESDLGRALSSFNLLITTNRGQALSVESAFQGSKVFSHGGPFIDLYGVESMTAKRDRRLRESGSLEHFDFFGRRWGLYPKTAFYDWIYLHALQQNQELAAAVTDFDCFTDIEFNPERSINCQARSVALFCALFHTDQLDAALRSPDDFKQLYDGKISEPGPTPENTLLL